MKFNTDSSTQNRGGGYECPRFERHDLRVITLGGTPGAGDSGNSNENPLGGRPEGEEKFDLDG